MLVWTWHFNQSKLWIQLSVKLESSEWLPWQPVINADWYFNNDDELCKSIGTGKITAALRPQTLIICHLILSLNLSFGIFKLLKATAPACSSCQHINQSFEDDTIHYLIKSTEIPQIANVKFNNISGNNIGLKLHYD